MSRFDSTPFLKNNWALTSQVNFNTLENSISFLAMGSPFEYMNGRKVATNIKKMFKDLHITEESVWESSIGLYNQRKSEVKPNNPLLPNVTYTKLMYPNIKYYGGVGSASNAVVLLQWKIQHNYRCW